MNLKNMIILTIMGLGVFTAGPVWAHTKVKSATLENGKSYQTLPETIDLVFAQKVGLIDVTLKSIDGTEIELDFEKPKGLHDRFAIPRPNLDANEYVLGWRVMAKDGHILNGEITFSYEP